MNLHQFNLILGHYEGWGSFINKLALTNRKNVVMTKFTEEQLNNFRYPPSYSEETKLSNAESQVRDALKDSAALKNKNYKIFGQGSYANDTNVKKNSDVDINVRLDDTVFVDLPEDKTYDDLGYSDSTYHYSDFRKDILDALTTYFGSSYIRDYNKCITVLPNTTRVEIDVVPTCKYIRYDSLNNIVEGVKFFAKDYTKILNFPLQHIENGKTKNSNTQKRFKRLTRIYRRIRYQMIDDGIAVSDNITSFLLECLIWNVPDRIFNGNDTWTDRLRESIIYLYNETDSYEKCKDWGEVSELLYLFRDSRKWSCDDVNKYLVQMWQYLKF